MPKSLFIESVSERTILDCGLLPFSDCVKVSENVSSQEVVKDIFSNVNDMFNITFEDLPMLNSGAHHDIEHISVETMTNELFKHHETVEKKPYSDSEMNTVGRTIKASYDANNQLDFNFLPMFNDVTLNDLLGIINPHEEDQVLNSLTDSDTRIEELTLRLKMVSQYQNDFSFNDLVETFGYSKIGELVKAATIVKNFEVKKPHTNHNKRK